MGFYQPSASSLVRPQRVYIISNNTRQKKTALASPWQPVNKHWWWNVNKIYLVTFKKSWNVGKTLWCSSPVGHNMDNIWVVLWGQQFTGAGLWSASSQSDSVDVFLAGERSQLSEEASDEAKQQHSMFPDTVKALKLWLPWRPVPLTHCLYMLTVHDERRAESERRLMLCCWVSPEPTFTCSPLVILVTLVSSGYPGVLWLHWSRPTVTLEWLEALICSVLDAKPV